MLDQNPAKPLEERLKTFLAEQNLANAEKFSKGWSSFLYLAEKNSKKYAVKIQRDDSPRSIEREALLLEKSNKAGIGPKVIAYDRKRKALFYEYIEATTMREFFLSNPGKSQLKKFLTKLFKQAQALDSIGLDHGQLQGKGTNILVKKDLTPIIVDFEKASDKRKPHNSNALQSLFYYASNLFSERVKKFFPEKEFKALLQEAKPKQQ